jgi:hypothetical protein
MITRTDQRCGRDSRRDAQRSLGAAEGILIALRRCSVDDAFAEIIRTAKDHNVAPIELAEALVSIAEDRSEHGATTEAVTAARAAWAPLLDRHDGGTLHRKHLYTQLVEPIPGADEADLLEQQVSITEDDDFSRN